MIGPTEQPGLDDPMAAMHRRLVKEVYHQVKSRESWGTFVESFRLSTQSGVLTCHINLLLIRTDGHIRLEASLKES